MPLAYPGAATRARGLRPLRLLAVATFCCCVMAASGVRLPGGSSMSPLGRLLSSEAPAGAPPPQAAPKVVTLRDTFTDVEWQGWGTTLGWWANFAGTYPEEEHGPLLDALFDPAAGLGLNIARYNIGAGSNATIDPQFVGEPLKFLATPGFRAAPDAEYDWAAEAAQQRILAGALRRGVDALEAIAFSPPWWMTVSGSVTGGYYGTADNLNPLFREAFAGYLTDVVAHFERALGVAFETLAPFNEPVEDWWVAGGRKEGCHVSPAGINDVVTLAAGMLGAQGLAARVSAADTWLRDAPGMLANLSDAALAAVARINVHSYMENPHRGGPGYVRTEMRQLARRLGKPVWVSEIGPQDLPFADEMDTALEVAAYVARDINELQPTAWVYWQALEQRNVGAGWYWGLLQLAGDFNTSEPLQYTIMKQYYVLMHFTRWFRPGCKFVVIGPELQDVVLAAWDESRGRLSVVLINPAPALTPVLLGLPGFVAGGGRAAELSRYRTSDGEDHRLVGREALASWPATLQVALGARSITTLVFDGVQRRPATAERRVLVRRGGPAEDLAAS